MSHDDSRHDLGEGSAQDTKSSTPAPQFQLTFVDSSFFFVSLLRQIRERWREPKLSLPAESLRPGVAPLPVTEMPPWYRDFPNQIRVLFEKPKPPRVRLTSQPIEVRNIWQDYRWQPASLLNSLLLHALVIAALTVPFAISRPKPVTADSGTVTRIYFSPADVPALKTAEKEQHADRGGGNQSPRPASRGAIPKFALLQLAPPSAENSIVPHKLAVTPSLIGPPQLTLPQMQVQQNWGDPNGIIGPDSDGPGMYGGIGPGKNGGIGPGKGPGWGDGQPGGDVYIPGVGGVTAPKPIYSPPPDYSEEARKAKLQGTVTLSLVVDVNGNPTDIRVLKSLGMGLDESAKQKAGTWRFVPGTRNGVPVPVRMILEVTFRLF